MDFEYNIEKYNEHTHKMIFIKKEFYGDYFKIINELKICPKVLINIILDYNKKSYDIDVLTKGYNIKIIFCDYNYKCFYSSNEKTIEFYHINGGSNLIGTLEVTSSSFGAKSYEIIQKVDAIILYIREIEHIKFIPYQSGLITIPKKRYQLNKSILKYINDNTTLFCKGNNIWNRISYINLPMETFNDFLIISQMIIDNYKSKNNY
jgi:hypothetical protein